MKKNLLIAALAGSFLIPTVSQSMIEPVTQAIAIGTIITAGVGAAGWTIGKYGVANTIGTPIAGAVGVAAGLIAKMAVDGLIAFELCPVLLAANPLVAPMLVGICTASIMLSKREQLFPGPQPGLKKLSTCLLYIAGGCLGATLACGTANLCGYNGISLHPTNTK